MTHSLESIGLGACLCFVLIVIWTYIRPLYYQIKRKIALLVLDHYIKDLIITMNDWYIIQGMWGLEEERDDWCTECYKRLLYRVKRLKRKWADVKYDGRSKRVLRISKLKLLHIYKNKIFVFSKP